MATDHKRLLSYSDNGSASQLPRTTLASVNVGGTKHLAVLKTTQAWDNRSFTLTPTDEKFFSAVACGTASSYQAQATDNTVYTDAGEIIDALRGLWANSTAASWTSGHKALCTYYARSFGAWAINISPQGSDFPLKVMEVGCTHVALKFNPRCFPISNCTAFSAKLRIYCPSSILHDNDNHNSVPTFNPTTTIAPNNGACVRYSFFSDLPAPSVLNSISNSFSFRLDSIANQGSSNAFAYAYDIWNIEPTLKPASNVWVYNNHRLIYDTPGTYFYHDVSIPPAVTDTLRPLLHSPFWLVLGFRQVPAAFQAVPPYSAATLYASRIELIFTATAPNTFNYDP